jgi:hypothetical protein
MPTVRHRKFTLLDAIVLIAATAVALVPARYFYAGLFGGGSADDATGGSSISNFVAACYLLSLPFLFFWSAALWGLRLRQPRPRSARIYRQPGTAACVTIVVSVMFRIARDVFIVWDPFGILAAKQGRFWHGLIVFGDLSEVYETTLAFGVPFVWLILWLSETWRAEPSWIDRAGRFVGLWCIAVCLLFDWGWRMR